LGLIEGTMTCIDSVMSADAGRVEVLAQASDMVGHIGHRKSKLDPLIAGSVIVEVYEGSCL
jgi:hypothetical protein